MSFLKVKAKPLKPRKPKTEYAIKTPLQSYKKLKLEKPPQQSFEQYIRDYNQSKEQPQPD